MALSPGRKRDWLEEAVSTAVSIDMVRAASNGLAWSAIGRFDELSLVIRPLHDQGFTLRSMAQLGGHLHLTQTAWYRGRRRPPGDGRSAATVGCRAKAGEQLDTRARDRISTRTPRGRRPQQCRETRAGRQAIRRRPNLSATRLDLFSWQPKSLARSSSASVAAPQPRGLPNEVAPGFRTISVGRVRSSCGLGLVCRPVASLGS
jgi:hypothetical protein